MSQRSQVSRVTQGIVVASIIATIVIAVFLSRTILIISVHLNQVCENLSPAVEVKLEDNKKEADIKEVDIKEVDNNK